MSETFYENISSISGLVPTLLVELQEREQEVVDTANEVKRFMTELEEGEARVAVLRRRLLGQKRD